MIRNLLTIILLSLISFFAYTKILIGFNLMNSDSLFECITLFIIHLGIFIMIIWMHHIYLWNTLLGIIYFLTLEIIIYNPHDFIIAYILQLIIIFIYMEIKNKLDKENY